ncbi:MAG: bifunctional acetate--CoA ligase family protein/GNAT family N-acetyltransferase, partial [Rhodothermales bacterium]|nr:bifunctional acetate--CoA ligase family protein/GNAT family N-acetyltransferase [Rhodothermales bacterium]
VPNIIHQCGEQGVPTAIVMSAGFAELEGVGKSREQALLAEARRYNLRVLGPNCLGLIRPSVGLNATFSNNTAEEGSLALVSQSGALCTAILDWAVERGIGFSAMVSMGGMADVDFGDVLDYLALDAKTTSILLYVEGVRNARSFMSGLRVAARLKPVIVVKAGRHSEGSKAVMSHTGSLVGGDDVFDAALQRAGVVRARTVEQLFSAAQLLSTRNRVRGDRLAIVTNAGGPGVLATDRAIDLGISLATLSPEVIKQLDEILPEHWSRGNPVDILGDATSERYHDAVAKCLADPEVDGVLAMLTPQAMTEPLDAARAVVQASKEVDKPLLATWLGDHQVKEARAYLAKNEVPVFPSPEASVEAFAYLAHYHRNQKLLLQTPGPLEERSEPDLDGARLIIEGALVEGRNLLNTMEAKALLTAFRIPVAPAFEARSASEALVAAENLGFPVVMKISSKDISHKSDVSGVRLNIMNARAVRGAYQDLVESVQKARPEAKIDGVTVEKMYDRSHGRELLVGIARDPVFGPTVAFGAGGTAVEVIRDRAVALPPLNSFIIDDLVKRTKIFRLLGDYRNMPAADMSALRSTLRRVSEMTCELPEIQELDINPLMLDPQGGMALDVRVSIDHVTPHLDPYHHMAVHPYPVHLSSTIQLADGTDVTIRPIRPEDAQIEHAFVRDLSPEAKYFRFMRRLQELTPEMLIRFTQIDYDREMALIAVVPENGADQQIAVGRYSVLPDGRSCEFALVVSDEWRRKGIGSSIMLRLMESARNRGYRTMEGLVLTENKPMLDLSKRLGFRVEASNDGPDVKSVVKTL